MFCIFKFELARLKKKKTCITLFVCLFVVFMLVAEGIFFYKIGETRDEYLVKLEKSRLDNYTTYVQYGTDGVGIYRKLPGINILFSPHKFIHSEMCNISNNSMLRIYADMRGNEIITYSSIINFSTILLLVIIFFAVTSGLTIFKSLKNIDFFGNPRNVWKAILLRFCFLSTGILLFFLSALTTLTIFNIHLSRAEIENLSYFFLQSLLVCALFYALSVLISITIHDKRKKLLFTGLLIGIIAILLPLVINFISSIIGFSIPVPAEVDYKKYEHILKFEAMGKETLKDTIDKERYKAMGELAREFVKSEYENVRMLEASRIQAEKEVFEKINKISIFSPLSFYFINADSVAGSGYGQYIAYVKYCNRKQSELLHFFVDKMYSLIHPESSGKVEPFFKHSENIFKTKSTLPGYYPLNLTITLSYLLVIILFITLRVRKHFNRKENIQSAAANSAVEQISRGRVIFVKVTNKNEKEQLFHFLKAGESHTSLAQISRADFPNIKIRCLYDLSRATKGIIEEKFFEYLYTLHIDRDILNKSVNDISHEDFKRVFAALELANNRKIMIINDYVYEENIELREDFINLITRICLTENRCACYLGLKMVQLLKVEQREIDDSEVSDQGFIVIDLNERTDNFQKRVIF